MLSTEKLIGQKTQLVNVEFFGIRGNSLIAESRTMTSVVLLFMVIFTRGRLTYCCHAARMLVHCLKRGHRWS